MKHLIPNIRIKLSSVQQMPLKWFCSATGIAYTLMARKLAHRILYSILQESEYDVATLYDGEDYEYAFELFCELAIAIKGISYSEDIAKMKDKLYNSSQKLISNERLQDMTLKIKPLSLGDSENAIC